MAILRHLQNVNQDRQLFYHLLIILILMLINKDRIRNLDHVSHDQIHIHVQDLMYPNQDSILDINIVIIMLFLLSLSQIKMSPVQQRQRHQKKI